MSSELAMLAASCGLCLIQIVIASHAAGLQRGYRWTASPRDGDVPPLKGGAGRPEKGTSTFPRNVSGLYGRGLARPRAPP